MILSMWRVYDFYVRSCGECELSGSEVWVSLLLSNSFSCCLELGNSLSESSGLLVSQVKRSTLLFVVNTSLISSSLVDHGQDLSDSFSNNLHKKTLQILRITLILASLTWGAAETLLTLNWANSFYRKFKMIGLIVLWIW